MRPGDRGIGGSSGRLVGLRRCAPLFAPMLLAASPSMLPAQDTTRSGVRIGITYTPGRRPALAVTRTRAGGPPVDSVRAIVERDLDQSDRFEMQRPTVGSGDTSLAEVLRVHGRSADVLVVVEPAPEGRVRLTAVEAASGNRLADLRLADAAVPAGRHAVHAAADAVVRASTGQAGVAATQLLFVRAGRIWRVDADGHGAVAMRTTGNPALSPAWAPDGRRFAYTAFVRSGQPIVLQDLATGRRAIVPTTEYGLNITPAFAPDGRRLAFARGTEAGTDLYLYDIGRGGVDRLTTGRFADNLSPAWSPDGGRLAFISTRARTPQLYVMQADGTGQEVLARFDFGATGTTSSPAWSPDGQWIAFHREVSGSPQLFVLDVATRGVRQLTSSGRNEDPTWAPDGRHLAFVSNRSGTRELWVLDVETGRLRRLTTLGGARLPAWSPALTIRTSEN